ncbi:4F5 domain-containing protein [Psidium guajava]|nr:4F5 domain-containing protein [Psidium guajava]
MPSVVCPSSITELLNELNILDRSNSSVGACAMHLCEDK